MDHVRASRAERRAVRQSGCALSEINAPDRRRFSMPEPNRFEENSMMDVVMVTLALGLFAVSVAYAYACDRL
jgi:hypothetical protein